MPRVKPPHGVIFQFCACLFVRFGCLFVCLFACLQMCLYVCMSCDAFGVSCFCACYARYVLYVPCVFVCVCVEVYFCVCYSVASFLMALVAYCNAFVGVWYSVIVCLSVCV